MMTETECEIQIKDGLSDYVPNAVLSQLLGESMQELGPVPFDENDHQVAQSFRDSLTEAEKKGVVAQLTMMGLPNAAEYADKDLFDGVVGYAPSSLCMPGSTDVGDVSYVTPTAQMTAATGCIGTPGHTWQQTAQAGSSIAHKGLLYAGKAMALAAAKVLADPSILKPAHDEYMAATGGKYNCPFPDDVKPYLDQFVG